MFQAASARLPFGTGEFVEKVTAGAANEVGKRTLQTLLTSWDATGGGPFAASVIGTIGVSKAVDVLQKVFMTGVFDGVLKALGADQLRLRASLCSAHLVGVGIMRYAAKTEPLASVDRATLVAAMAPTLQRYLTGDIS